MENDLSKKFRNESTMVIVKPTEEKTKTNSGLSLPSDAIVKPSSGEVVLVGNLVVGNIKVDDEVLFSKSAGFPIELENNTFKMMGEKEILLIKNK